MIVETRIFGYLCIFFFIMGGIYGGLTKYFSGYTEWAGTVAIIMTGGLFLIVSQFFQFTARRLSGPRPEDSPDATVEDNPEELGFFSPGSIWPIAVSGSIAFVAVGIIFGYFWFIATAVVVLISAVCGLVFEYYRAPEKH